jgi:type IV secretion system protein VirB3
MLGTGNRPVRFDLSWWTRTFIRRIVSNTTRASWQRARRAASTKDEATLFIADTRPAMTWGVPHQMAVVIFMVFGETMIFGGPIIAIVILVYLWVLARVIVRRDYNMARIIMLWAETKALSLDRWTWGGASPSPHPPRRSKYPRGVTT